VLLMLWWYQERIVFQPPSGIPNTDVSARRVTYRASDGKELFGYLVGDCRDGSTLVLAFHGNADIARWFVSWASVVVRRTQACVLLPEYRGYDGIVGPPTYATSANDAQAALAYVRDTLQVPPSRTVYFGHSLGTAIAAELASIQTPRSLLLQSPFSSAKAMARRMFLPGLTLFWRLVSRVHFDTIARVRVLDAPVWVAHGDRDIVVPVWMGREVFSAAKAKGELLIVHGARHSDVPEVGGEAYWDWLTRAVGALPAPTTDRAAAAGTRPEP
jgi:fermentation-respiration switch protein FrsA (DUF1100 family)